MKRRRFGSTGLEVSEFGLGCARIGGMFQQDPGAFVRLLQRARDADITFFDTADMYSQGESESLIGKALAGRRDRIVIATKAGYCLPARRKLLSRVKPLLRPIIKRLGLRRDKLSSAMRGSISQDFSPKYLESALDGSLRRLRTDYVDLLQLHSPPREVIERGEWLPALERLQRAGKIRHYGIAVDSVEAGLAALAYPGVVSLQFQLSLLNQEATETLLPRARAQRVGFIARECLANGLLVKREDEIDLSKFYDTDAERTARAARLAALRNEASSAQMSLARHALSYVNGVEGVSVALIGARTIEQLEGLLRELP
jgi:aryl-alcohol dehydrogenase-like predicted oxidoreductase